jgi:hypothetical protein
VPLKRPVTLPQARRWPAAAKRRESFCARMGGVRDTLTGEDAATDPDSPINRALAAWDCDKPEGLRRQHVSKGIRPMKITQSKVGAEARKLARKTAAKNPRRRMTQTQKVDPFQGSDRLEGYGPRKGLEGPFLMRNGRVVYYDSAEGAYYDPKTDFYLSMDEAVALSESPARKNPAKPKDSMLYVVHVADSLGKPAYDIAKFRKRADALQYARSYADANGVRVVLTSKPL